MLNAEQKQQMADLEREKQEVLLRSKPLRDKEEELLAVIHEHEAELKKLRAEIITIERDALNKIAYSKSAIAKAAGGIRMHHVS